MPLSRSAWRHFAIHRARASAVKFGSTSNKKIKWPSMASTASMRSSVVAGWVSCIAVLFLSGVSDIGVAVAMVAKGAAWAGCFVMAYASTWLRSAASACRAAGLALLVAFVCLVQVSTHRASRSAVNRGSHSSTSTICCNSRVMASTWACSEACSVCEGV